MAPQRKRIARLALGLVLFVGGIVGLVWGQTTFDYVRALLLVLAGLDSVVIVVLWLWRRRSRRRGATVT